MVPPRRASKARPRGRGPESCGASGWQHCGRHRRAASRIVASLRCECRPPRRAPCASTRGVGSPFDHAGAFLWPGILPRGNLPLPNGRQTLILRVHLSMGRAYVVCSHACSCRYILCARCVGADARHRYDDCRPWMFAGARDRNSVHVCRSAAVQQRPPVLTAQLHGGRGGAPKVKDR